MSHRIATHARSPRRFHAPQRSGCRQSFRGRPPAGEPAAPPRRCCPRRPPAGKRAARARRAGRVRPSRRRGRPGQPHRLPATPDPAAAVHGWAGACLRSAAVAWPWVHGHRDDRLAQARLGCKRPRITVKRGSAHARTAMTITRPDRYKPNPSVLTALRSPRLLTREVLAGLVVAMALIPEAISFSIIAGVDPRYGLFSSFVMAVSIAFLGGRPAMITAATGAVALVIAPVAREYGIDYFIATVILAGIFQVILGVIGVAKLMRFIPRSVMVGFVNALAILIFTSQLPHLFGDKVTAGNRWWVYGLVVVGLVIMVLLPRLTKVVPAPLVAIALITGATVLAAINVPTVG